MEVKFSNRARNPLRRLPLRVFTAQTPTLKVTGSTPAGRTAGDPRKCKASGDFCIYPKDVLCPRTLWKNFRHLPPHIFLPRRTSYLNSPRSDRRERRMAFSVLMILCAAIVLVMLACLWVNR